MNEPTDDLTADLPSDATLDPPGTITILGTTPLGIEAALYGRYLGYDVQLLAATDDWAFRSWPSEASTRRIGPRFTEDWWSRNWVADRDVDGLADEPLPMLPDRCLSPLAMAALAAQRGERSGGVLPVTMRQWLDAGLVALTQSDLLVGRVHPMSLVERIERVPVLDDPDVAPEDEVDDEEIRDVPEDFLLHLSHVAPPSPWPAPPTIEGPLRCEAIIVADLDVAKLALSFDLPADYFAVLSSVISDDAETMLRDGWRQITATYAALAGRPTLDLYRPLRV